MSNLVERVEQTPKLRYDVRGTSSTLLRTGIYYYGKEDYRMARICLGLAESVLSDLDKPNEMDKIQQGIIQGWCVSALKKLGLTKEEALAKLQNP